MSTDRASNTNRPLKPTLASNRTRTPITPRVAGNATPTTRSTASRPSPTVRSEPSTPRVNKATNTPLTNIIANGNVTPRSSARTSRVESATTSPSQKSDTPSAPRPKSAIVAACAINPRNGNNGGLGISVGEDSKARGNRTKSLVDEDGTSLRTQSPLVRSPGLGDIEQDSPADSIDDRFFHASDAPKQQDTKPKRPEPKKTPSFFYASGQQAGEQRFSQGAASPVLSAVSDQRSTGPWIRSENGTNGLKSPSIMSPGLSTLSSASPFFAPAAIQPSRQRSPSPSKENIHLSYRKGASQIFGTRPTSTPRSITSNVDLSPVAEAIDRRSSNDATAHKISRHHESPSLSSIDSINSHQSPQREASPSPLTHGFRAATIPLAAKQLGDLPTIDTSLEPPGVRSPAESALSPSKTVSELAAGARRERKVLDLEISNSSLMAINTSLEREVRRQKAELKRFRRLSRAGRFSFAPVDWPPRVSDGLSAVGEEDEEDDSSSMFGPPSGLSGLCDDMSDDEESLVSSVEPLSPSAQSRRQSDRLAKDEKRLQVDLQKHRELLVQSQAMNQSLKRCMYATEEMIREGKKALDYRVRVSDIRLGGRVLSSHEDDEDDSREIDVDDEHHYDDDMDQAKGLLDVWTGVGRQSFEESEGGDRDSGIEVDRPQPPHTSLPLAPKSGSVVDSGWPPEAAVLGAQRDLASLS